MERATEGPRRKRGREPQIAQSYADLKRGAGCGCLSLCDPSMSWLGAPEEMGRRIVIECGETDGCGNIYLAALAS